jgi:hypothetical protein
MEGPAEGAIVVQRVRTSRELWEVRHRDSGEKPEGRLISDATSLDEAKRLACDAAPQRLIWIEEADGQFTAHDCGPEVTEG